MIKNNEKLLNPAAALFSVQQTWIRETFTGCRVKPP